VTAAAVSFSKRNKFEPVGYSQIKTFTSCPRKWWINKVAGVATPSTPATERGSAVHTIIESYLVNGAEVVA
jgi:CRISPR/Cas system-associated exonuclease Cas4 (RecB family)